ncbi:MAG: hypothetical protein AAF502_01560 [Bacteroidota bacterium]
MKEFRTMPIYMKGQEIIDLTRALVASFKESKESQEIGQLMMENAYTITSKIARAEGEDWYSNRLDNATLIKLAAKELIAQVDLCRSLELTDCDYLDLVDTEMDKFRMVFLEWVASFNEDNDMIDEWSFHHLR